ncbi:MAG: ATP-binding cassette domain-containing protein [Opitutales bacterium]|jgi:ABC-type lipoprotein export system ATPase subunit
MNITLSETLPYPMAEAPPETSEIWQKEITFEQGGRYLVVGESGCGKSTLIHMLCGMRRDYHGSVLLEDQEARTLSPLDWARLRAQSLGLVFQDLRLFSDLTARENLSLLPIQEPGRPKIGEMAEQLGMSPFMDRPCGKLSHGQRQRIAVMRVLCRPFELLLLDEPFSHLDDSNVEAMTSLIEAEIERRGAGLILASLMESSPFRDLHSLRI